MPVTALEISYSGQPYSVSPTEYIEIKVTLLVGRFVTQPLFNGYTLAVFYGIPPDYGRDYPVVNPYVYSEQLIYSGDINSLYAVAQVETQGPVIEGEITVDQPLPFQTSIGRPGLSESVILEPGETKAFFSFPARELEANKLKAIIDKRMAELGIR
ncbi:MAG: hypothetical protein AAFP19_13485 [Bacteroidota bacterium]